MGSLVSTCAIAAALRSDRLNDHPRCRMRNWCRLLVLDLEMADNTRRFFFRIIVLWSPPPRRFRCRLVRILFKGDAPADRILVVK